MTSKAAAQTSKSNAKKVPSAKQQSSSKGSISASQTTKAWTKSQLQHTKDGKQPLHQHKSKRNQQHPTKQQQRKDSNPSSLQQQQRHPSSSNKNTKTEKKVGIKQKGKNTNAPNKKQKRGTEKKKQSAPQLPPPKQLQPQPKMPTNSPPPVRILQASDFPALSASSVAAATWRAAVNAPPKPPSQPPALPNETFPSLSAAAAHKPTAVKPVKAKFVPIAKPQTKKEAAPPAKKPPKATTTNKPPGSLLAAFAPAPIAAVGDEHALLRLMQQGKMVVQNKGRQRIRPRKKKFSPLKKKVLEERLKQWKLQQGEGTTDDAAKTSAVVEVVGFCQVDELEDADEYQEICENWKDIATKVGEVKRLWVPTESNDPTVTEVPVFCEFATTSLAAQAEKCWDGLMLGGNELQVTIIAATDVPVEDDAWHKWCIQQSPKEQSTVVDGAVGGEDSMEIDSTVEIVLSNALTEDDLEDEECMEESLEDIRKLASSYGDLVDVCLEDTGVLILTYRCSVSRAREICAQLGKVVIAGETLSALVRGEKSISEGASVDQTVVLRNVVTEDDVEDEECLEESVADIMELAKQYGNVGKINTDTTTLTVSLTYSTIDEAKKALEGFHGMVIGGATVAACIEGKTESEAGGVAEETNPPTETAKDPEPMFSGDKRIPERFAECKRAPKIPNSGKPRNYAVLSEHESVKPLLVEMLAELMRLQKRAVEDKNAKARRRLVMGLREVARGIRARKVRMVVMANNLDEYGVLDEKLQEILDMARKEDLPVFFEFSKRTLGKAIGKSIKIAVVGIQNCDGANQQFKKLSTLAPSLPG